MLNKCSLEFGGALVYMTLTPCGSFCLPFRGQLGDQREGGITDELVDCPGQVSQVTESCFLFLIMHTPSSNEEVRGHVPSSLIWDAGNSYLA